VCMSHLRGDAAGTPPVVVSVRVGSHNTTFEEAVFEVLGVKAHLFDPLLTEPDPKLTYLTAHPKEAVAGLAGIRVLRSRVP